MNDAARPHENLRLNVGGSFNWDSQKRESTPDFLPRVLDTGSGAPTLWNAVAGL